MQDGSKTSAFIVCLTRLPEGCTPKRRHGVIALLLGLKALSLPSRLFYQYTRLSVLKRLFFESDGETVLLMQSCTDHTNHAHAFKYL